MFDVESGLLRGFSVVAGVVLTVVIELGAVAVAVADMVEPAAAFAAMTALVLPLGRPRGLAEELDCVEPLLTGFALLLLALLAVFEGFIAAVAAFMPFVEVLFLLSVPLPRPLLDCLTMVAGSS